MSNARKFMKFYYHPIDISFNKNVTRFDKPDPDDGVTRSAEERTVSYRHLLETDKYGLTLVDKAALKNNQSLLDNYFKILMTTYHTDASENNINSRYKDFMDNTALHWAILCNQPISLINDLIEKGSDVDAADRYGRTPAHIAARFNRVECLELLSAKGADLNICDGNDDTPLKKAIYYSNESSVKALIDGGASVNRVDKSEDPLYALVYHPNMNILRLILDAKIDALDKIDSSVWYNDSLNHHYLDVTRYAIMVAEIREMKDGEFSEHDEMVKIIKEHVESHPRSIKIDTIFCYPKP